MPETKWTPGTWVKQDGIPYVNCGDDGPCFGPVVFARTADEMQANARLIAAAPALYEALKAAVSIAEEARKEWDAAPNGMRAGKLLIALAGHIKGYRADIDAIHAALAKAEGRQ